MKVLKLKLAGSGLVTVIAVMVLTMLISTADTSYNIRVLSSEQMRSISGGCQQCTKDVGLNYYCDCAQLGEHWTVCSVSKNVKQCEDKPTGTCTDSNKSKSATGSTYEDYEMTDWHKCNYASYCPTVNWDGLNYIGSNTCYVVYYGCN